MLFLLEPSSFQVCCYICSISSLLQRFVPILSASLNLVVEFFYFIHALVPLLFLYSLVSSPWDK